MGKKILLVSDSWAWSWYPGKSFKSKSFFDTFSQAKPGQFTRLIVDDNVNINENDFKIARINLIETLLNSIGHNVQTVAQPGESVPGLLDLLYKHNVKHEGEFKNLDLIVWIITDPIRNMFTDLSAQKNIQEKIIERVNTELQQLKTKDQFINKILEYSRKNYLEISNFSNRYFNGVPVLLAGGAGKVYKSVMDQLKTRNHFCCHLLCESLLEVLSQGKWSQSDLYFTNIPLDKIKYEKLSVEIIELLHASARNHTASQILHQWQVPDSFHLNANGALFVADLIQHWIEQEML